MTAKIVAFGLSRPVAQERIRAFMKAGAFTFDPHCREAMLERDISMRQVMRAVEEGSISQGPARDEYGDWRCRIKKRVAGRLVRVVVAIQSDEVLIVTTF